MYSELSLIVVIHLLGIQFICLQGCDPENLAPVVLVPGLGGSRLEAQLNKPTILHRYCTRNTFEYYTLWLDVKQLLPLVIDCWVDNMKLNFDEYSNKTFNQPGVETRVPDFGNAETVEYLDSDENHMFGGYLNHLSSSFVGQGYIRGKNLYGAPYDFRKGPSELNHLFESLEELIENAYDYNNNSSVILIGHSLGGQLTLNFLNSKSQEWKDKYIRAFISLSTPFRGTMKSVKSFLIGDDLGVFLLGPQILKEVLSTMPSMAYLIPHKEIWGDEVLVSTAEKHYTLDDLEEFFNDIGNPNGWKMYLNEKEFTNDLSPPGVEMHCLYGGGIATLKRLIYKSHDFKETPMIEYENGDGTANLRSLEYCKRWIPHQKERLETKSFDEVDHMGIIENKWVLHHVSSIIKELSGC